MITQWLIDIFTGIVTFLLSMIPTFTMPDFWSGALTQWSTVVGTATALGNWVPLGAAVQVVTFLLAIWAVSVSIRLGRMVISLLTGGGGSAA